MPSLTHCADEQQGDLAGLLEEEHGSLPFHKEGIDESTFIDDDAKLWQIDIIRHLVLEKCLGKGEYVKDSVYRQEICNNVVTIAEACRLLGFGACRLEKLSGGSRPLANFFKIPLTFCKKTSRNMSMFRNLLSLGPRLQRKSARYSG